MHTLTGTLNLYHSLGGSRVRLWALVHWYPLKRGGSTTETQWPTDRYGVPPRG